MKQTDKQFKPLWISIGAIGFFLVMGFAGNADYEDALLAERGYCRNVTLYYTSGGELGWPDYEGYYSTVCERYSEDPELFFKG